MLIGRTSFMQRFNHSKDNVLESQSTYTTDSIKLNSGQRNLTLYEDPQASYSVSSLSGQVVNLETRISQREIAKSTLEVSETLLSDMKDILDVVKADIITGSSTQSNAKDREVFGNKLRTLTENFYQLANTRVNDKYIFSGIQSDTKTLDFDPQDVFNNPEFMEGEDYLADKDLYGTPTSVNLERALNTEAEHASVTGSAPAVPITFNGDVRFIIKDGTGQGYDTGDINLTAGDNLAAVITKINTAANAAGIPGALAEEDPVGFLKINNGLIEGSVANNESNLTVIAGTTPSNVLTDLGLREQKSQGESPSIPTMLGDLYEAYITDDPERIRLSLVDVNTNIERLLSTQSLTGNLSNRLEQTKAKEQDLLDKKQIDKSDVEDISASEAIIASNQSKLVLDNVMRYTPQIMNASIFQFI
jgi:flagellin-like hook-associated protein FlgL